MCTSRSFVLLVRVKNSKNTMDRMMTMTMMMRMVYKQKKNDNKNKRTHFVESVSLIRFDSMNGTLGIQNKDLLEHLDSTIVP